MENTKKKNFNIFNILPKKYLREEFHSTFLKNLLSNEDNPQYGKDLFYLLIDCLNNAKKKACPAIEFNDFLEYKVETEIKNIDILITGTTKKGAKSFIIIENKINDAPDKPRQLIRYFEEKEEEKDGDVKAIVYLPLTEYKTPNYKEVFPQKLTNRLIELPVFKENGKSLINGWLEKSIEFIRVHEGNNLGAHRILENYKSFLDKKLEKEKKLLKLGQILEKTGFIPEGYEDLMPEFIVKKIGKESGLYDFYHNWGYDDQKDYKRKQDEKTRYFKFSNRIKPFDKILPNVIRISSNPEESIIHLWASTDGKASLEKIKEFLCDVNAQSDFKDKEYDIKKNNKIRGYIREFKTTPKGFKEMRDFMINDFVPKILSITQPTESSPK